MPKSIQLDPDVNDRNEILDIKTDSESENEASVREPPLKKSNPSTSSSNMPSRKKKSKEKDLESKDDNASTPEILTPEVLKDLLNKITSGLAPQDVLVAIDRLQISEILILKRRISKYDLSKSMDQLSREINHINSRADQFTDSADAVDESRSNDAVGIKILLEEIKDLRNSVKEDMKEVKNVLRKFSEEVTEPMAEGKEIYDILTARRFIITRYEKVEDLEMAIAEEVNKNDNGKLKARKALIIPNSWQVPFSLLRLTIRIRENKTRKDMLHASIHHLETPQALRRFGHDLEKILLDQQMIFQNSTFVPQKLNVNRLASFAFHELQAGLSLCVISLN